MPVSASQVKELRERTGAGMMECKRHLEACDGNLEAAIDALRKAGQAKAVKKSGRVAAEGLVAVRTGAESNMSVLVEVNSETDFTARDDHFAKFVEQLLDQAESSPEKDLAALSEAMEPARLTLIQQVGENINIRRLTRIQGEIVGRYVHGDQRIAVLVALKGGDQKLAHEIAMHIAASAPLVRSQEELSQEILKKEEEIFRSQAEASGKPSAIVEKMVAGRIKSFLKEKSLLDQPFVKDTSISVRQMLENAGAEVVEFARYELGEGIEKQVSDFAAEVQATAGL